MAGGGVSRNLYGVLQNRPGRGRSGCDLLHLRDGFEIEMNFDRNVSCLIAVYALMDNDFFNQAVTVLQTLVIALGAGLGIWGVINLLEGYGNDNPGAKSQGIKQLMAGGGVALIGTILVPLLSGLFG